MVYLYVNNKTGRIYLATLLGAFTAGLFGEIFARIFHMPSSVFTVPGIINLCPGSGIYYTISYYIQGENLMANQKLTETCIIAGAISFGILLASTGSQSLNRFKRKNQEKKS